MTDRIVLPPDPSAPPRADERWRELVGLAADLAFETDARGCISFVHPDGALGWPASALLGRPAALLAAGRCEPGGFDPFGATAPARGRACLLRADGTAVPMLLSVAPLRDRHGRAAGVRGIGRDARAEDGRNAATAAALRRGELLDHVLWRIRQETLAPRMMAAVLDALADALGAEGAAVVDLLRPAVGGAVLHGRGEGTDAVMADAWALLQCGASEPASGEAAGRPLLACPCSTRFGERAGVVAWRRPGGRAWVADDLVLLSSAAGVARVLLEHESIQREMARQARTDPLTGLPDRRAFAEEVSRRIDRLDREELPGTLLFVDLDEFKALNDGRGHDAGDEALVLCAQLLRACVRPSDLVARLGGDEFAVWLDGADEMTAAERAEALRRDAPGVLAALVPRGGPALGMSVGIACRRPGGGEDLDSVMRRADAAMYEAKRTGRGRWCVARPLSEAPDAAW